MSDGKKQVIGMRILSHSINPNEGMGGIPFHSLTHSIKLNTLYQTCCKFSGHYHALHIKISKQYAAYLFTVSGIGAFDKSIFVPSKFNPEAKLVG